jgi:hypothetical protein
MLTLLLTEPVCSDRRPKTYFIRNRSDWFAAIKSSKEKEVFI